MKSDIRYIIKKVIIGLLILLAYKIIDGRLGFVYNVNAKEIFSKSFDQTTYYVTNQDNFRSYHYITFGPHVHVVNREGTVVFGFSLSSNELSTHAPWVIGVEVNNDGYTNCEFGSTSANTIQNPTGNLNSFQSSYSVSCRVQTSDNGITGFKFILGWPITRSDAYINVSDKFTFIGDDDVVGAIDKQTEETKKQTQETKKINDSINNTNTDDAEDKGGGFFDDFQSDSHGLSGVITSPLRLLNSFTTSSCQPLSFHLPIVHDNVSLPCMKSIYENRFGVFFSLWQLITTGLISYNVMINLYSKIRNLQNPNNDRIEVLNL